jgi:hypothetical protein
VVYWIRTKQSPVWRNKIMELNEALNDGGESTEQGSTTPTDSASHADADDQMSAEFDAAFADVFGGGAKSGDSIAGDGGGEAPEDGATTDDGDDESEDGKTIPPTDKTASGDKPNVGADKGAQEALATLPRTLRSAAERAGYSETDLAKDITDLGVERVSGILERLHGGFNDLSTRYAQLGRAAQPASQQQPTNGGGAPAEITGIDALFEPKTLAEFEQEYGKGIVEKVLKPLQAELQPLREIKTAWQAQQRAALQTEITGVFGAVGEEFAALYGKGGMDQISAEAREHRMTVLRDADMILGGAQRAGVQMTNREAIERAHNLYVAPRRAEFERKALTSKVKGRAGAITARPSNRRVAPARAGAGVAKNDQSLMDSLGRREAELGVDFFQD